MKICLVSHASVIVECTDLRIWTDPWLFGKAFNNSWTLFPPAVFAQSLLPDIDYIWISHEHPDHFHVPTLKSLADSFKERVTILFQENNSEKMFEAFKMFGFQRFRALPHRKIVPLSEATHIYCYHVGQMDSTLAIINKGKTLLNVNDAEINTSDCRLILKDIRSVDVVLTQFSIAGYCGLKDYQKYLPLLGKRILENISANHKDLGAKATIPFASFIYFSCMDNKYINTFINKPSDVYDYLLQKGQEVAILYPGDTYDMNLAYDSASALERYEVLYATFDSQVSYQSASIIPLPKIAEAFQIFVQQLHEKYPKIFLRLLEPIRVYIPDLETKVVFSISTGMFQEAVDTEEADLMINSQPFHFCFNYPYGVQTLGVSARFTLLRNFRNWRLHRILFALNNAEIYLRPKYFFTQRNFNYIKNRWRGALNQFLYQLQRML
jgi:hypothetical protein